MKLAGKVAVVTGGSEGLGLAVAKALLKEGARVALIARNKDNLEKALQSIEADFKGNAFVISADVGKNVDVSYAVGKIAEKYGHIDILVNAAGISMREPQKLQDIDADFWRRMIDTNLTGTFLMCREVLPLMVKKNHGYIINVLSTGAFKSSAGNSAYAASKFGVRALTEALFEENKCSGVKVSSISPGAIDTNIWSHKTKAVTQEEKATMLKADEVADIILFLLTRPDNVYIDNITVKPWLRGK